MEDLMEQERLLLEWVVGSFPTLRENAEWHFAKHGVGVGAADLLQYLRKAEAFRQEKRGTGLAVAGHTPGVRRFPKRIWYIDLTADSKIVSFGLV